MSIAEINDEPGSPQIGVGDPLAVLIDEVERTADRAAEPGSGDAARAFPLFAGVAERAGVER
jgi:hypothetical protein